MTGYKLLWLLPLCAFAYNSTNAQAQTHLYNPPKNVPSDPNVIIHETEGNLKVTAPMGCVAIDEIDNKHSPADIFTGVRACLEIEDFEQAIKLTSAANVIAQYDMRRVTDRTAHQASLVLLQNSVYDLPQSTIVAFASRLMVPEFEASFCDTLAALNKPSYYPEYMVAHGIKAFGGPQPNDGIVEDFDSQYVWETALPETLNCSAQ